MAREARSRYTPSIMRVDSTRKFLAKAAFILGILFTVSGGGVLFAVASGGSGGAALISSGFVAAGVFCAVLAARLHGRSRYMFAASFMILAGLYLLLSASGVIAFPFLRSWPVLSVFTGLSLIPAGYHRYRSFRSRYVVPALAFTILGAVLLVFSFRLVPFSFRRFILDWWPLLLVLSGVLLTLVSLGSRDSGAGGAGS